MAANAGHGAGKANNKAKDQARAAAMKDTPHRRGTERLTMMCPNGCGTAVRREITGCKSEQREGLSMHLAQCRGKFKLVRNKNG